jgi:hypothetical protein
MPRGRPLVIPWHEEALTRRALYHQERDVEIRPRLHAVGLRRAGQPLRQGVALRAVHYSTVQDWVAWYRRGGLPAVRRHKLGVAKAGPASWTPPHSSNGRTRPQPRRYARRALCQSGSPRPALMGCGDGCAGPGWRI